MELTPRTPSGAVTSAAVTATQLPEIYGHSRKVYALEYNSTGTLLASGSNDKTIRIWFVDSVRRVHAFFSSFHDSLVAVTLFT